MTTARPGRRYDVDLTFDNVIVHDGSFQIIDYEFLTEERCQLYAILHAVATFCERRSRFCEPIGLYTSTLFDAYHLTEDEENAFHRDEYRFVQSRMDFVMLKYARTRKPWQA